MKKGKFKTVVIFAIDGENGKTIWIMLKYNKMFINFAIKIRRKHNEKSNLVEKGGDYTLKNGPADSTIYKNK